MQLDTPQFHGLFTPELKQLISLFEKHNYELRVAGGAVRDLLMGKQPNDVDFATTATPTEMKEMFELEKVRMINAKGESHGTVTARINDKENFEVTTLRIDVTTDGRHAEVEFTTDWLIDANRRDLTINSMFLGFDGTIYDYFNGVSDLEQRLVRFVGNPVARIQEDYLRILRYFRFYGRIANGPDAHDHDTLTAIKANTHGLQDISGERIWVELKQIVCGNFAGSLMKTMFELGVTRYLGIPENPNIEEFLSVCERTDRPLPMTRLSALLIQENEVYNLNKRLKMSSDELKLGVFIVNHREDNTASLPLKHYQDLLIDTVGKEPKVRERIIELLKYNGDQKILLEFSEWTAPKFPVTGYDLMNGKVPKGPVFTKTLIELRKLWKQSDYTLTKEELLMNLERIVKGLQS
ncbi:hypothetical protein ScPMuIL_014329 [Solemya velum]